MLASKTCIGSIGISAEFWHCSLLEERSPLPIESACEWYFAVFPLRRDTRSLNSSELTLRTDFELAGVEPVSLSDFEGTWDFLGE